MFDILLTSLVKETLSLARDRLASVFESKDASDRQELNEVEKKLANSEKKLESARTELVKLESDTGVRHIDEQKVKNIEDRVSKAEREVFRLSRKREVLIGERVLEIGATPSDLADILDRGASETAKWANQIKFVDADRARRLDQIYISLEIYLNPQRNRSDTDESTGLVRLENLLHSTARHVILLGQAGAGKITSMKRIFLDAYSEYKCRANASVPLLIVFRDLKAKGIGGGQDGVLFEAILRKLGLYPDFGD